MRKSALIFGIATLAAAPALAADPAKIDWSASSCRQRDAVLSRPVFL